jgi:hypothetical protein
MTIGDEDEGIISGTIATLFGRLEEPGHLRFGEKVLALWHRVACRTRDITNVG